MTLPKNLEIDLRECNLLERNDLPPLGCNIRKKNRTIMETGPVAFSCVVCSLLSFPCPETQEPDKTGSEKEECRRQRHRIDHELAFDKGFTHRDT